jgi:hypothetical protein
MSVQTEHCGGVNCPFEHSCVDGCMYPKKKVVEEAHRESQESIWSDAEELAWGELTAKFIKEEGTGEFQVKARVHHVIDVLKEHFTITRKQS